MENITDKQLQSVVELAMDMLPSDDYERLKNSLDGIKSLNKRTENSVLASYTLDKIKDWLWGVV